MTRPLTEAQADGQHCVDCDRPFASGIPVLDDAGHAVRSATGSQLFRCEQCLCAAAEKDLMCPACHEGRCAYCPHPFGAQLAADGHQYPTCCCGRQFIPVAFAACSSCGETITRQHGHSIWMHANGLIMCEQMANPSSTPQTASPGGPPAG